MKRFLLLHGFSADNAGDGLLVELSCDLLAEAGYNVGESYLVASDPSSMRHVGANVASPRGFDNRSMAYPMRCLQLVVTGSPSVRRLAREVDLIVGVGGGYLRAGSRPEAAKTLLAHLWQLRVAADAGTRAVYLPQSIGPLRVPVFPRVLARLLSRVDTVYVRDDRSVTELERLRVSAERMPDLAVLELARRLDEVGIPCAEGGREPRIGLVARGLAGESDAYYRKVEELASGRNVRILLQSTVGRSNNDAQLARSLGASDPISLHEATRRKLVDVTISVRLHGSLQSLLNGVPSLHLSYERKGVAAYEDLGLGRYVSQARSFDPHSTLELAHEVGRDPRAFWAQIKAQVPRLVAQRTALLDALGPEFK